MAAMAELDLTPRQYAVLVTVAAHEGLSQTDLVKETGVDRSTLADIVRRMLRKGLLLRERTKHDARAYAIRLSDKGSAVLARAAPAAIRADDTVLQALTPRQRDQLVYMLNAIVRGDQEATSHGGDGETNGDGENRSDADAGLGHPEAA